jgi:hypothetical protein
MQQQSCDAQLDEEGATAHPSNWVQQVEEAYPELPNAKTTSNKVRQQMVHDRQKQQQPTPNNTQQRRPSTSAAASDSGTQRQRDSKDKPRSQPSSRGNNRTSSRQASKERAIARNGDKHCDNGIQEGRSRPLSPPPFCSYFKGRVYTMSVMGQKPTLNSKIIAVTDCPMRSNTGNVVIIPKTQRSVMQLT